MKQFIQTTPGYKLNEYLLVLTPHDELRQRIVNIRKDFSEKFGLPASVGSKVHLAILRFSQLEMMEDKITNRLHAVAMGFPPFKVELQNFAAFPTHSLHIAVTTKIPINQLQRELKGFQRLMKPDSEHKPHFMDEPNIPIARKLLPWQFEKGWLEYQHRHFSGRFIADSMLLLKKPEEQKSYQVVQRFAFENLPVNIKQGDLFF